MSEPPGDSCEFSANDLIVKFDLRVAGDVQAINPAVEHIMRIVDGMACGTGKEFEIETAIREALANAIVHGCKRDRELTVQISVGCDDGRGLKDESRGWLGVVLPWLPSLQCLLAAYLP